MYKPNGMLERLASATHPSDEVPRFQVSWAKGAAFSSSLYKRHWGTK